MYYILCIYVKIQINFIIYKIDLNIFCLIKRTNAVGMTTQVFVLNSDLSIHWANYKFYTQMKLNGGKELEPPYSAEEIQNVLTQKHIILTEELMGSALYSYLTKVSRKIYAGSSCYEKVVFDLNEFPGKEEQEKICIPPDIKRITEDDIYYNDEPDVIDKEIKYEGDHLDNCMATISQGDESYYYIYLGSGIHYGSIWYNYNCDYWSKEDISFQDYLIKHFKMG